MPLTRLQHRKNLAEAAANAQPMAEPTTPQGSLCMPLTRLQHRRNLAEAGAKAQTKANRQLHKYNYACL